MDAVRFGRALGFGARQAAKTVIRAADAARAENPSQPQATPRPAATVRTASAPVIDNRRATPQSRQTPPASTPSQHRARPPAPNSALREGLGRFRDSAVEPVVRLSAVLWLEVMGAVFALFALAAANGLWRLRAERHAALTHPFAHGTVLGTAAIFLLFAYFSISSFVRAYHRQHRR